MGGAVTQAVLRRLHRWIGLALALPLVVQALTGFILAADPFTSAIQNIPSSGGPLIRPDDLRNADVLAILNAASASVAADLVPVRWRVSPNAVIAVDFAPLGHQQPTAQVAVDALSSRVMSMRNDPDGFYRWVHSVHETLLLGPLGRGVIGWVGVALLLLALSGIPLWWPARGRWQAGFTVSRRAHGWRFQRELHGAAGIWMMALLLLQSVSGVALAFPQTFRAIAGLPAQGTRGGPVAGGAKVDPVRSIVAGVAAAEAAVPQAVLLDFRFPAVPGRPMMAVLLPPGRWAGTPATIVFMDPATARVLSIQDPGTASTGASVLNWLRALHEGGAAGPGGRVLICLFAIVLPLFPVTGIVMWTLRWRMRRRLALRQSANE